MFACDLEAMGIGNATVPLTIGGREERMGRFATTAR